MKKNSLTPNKGLSLSQAQSISNLCNQRATEITSKLSSVNNYQKKVNVDGNDYITVTAKKLPEDVVPLLNEKSALYACQAFLMENIKAKEARLQEVKKSTPDFSSIEMPKKPEFVTAKVLPQVGESWGWEQLTVSEVNEFIESEAFASHIGQFIHEGSPLDKLRRELPEIPAIEWTTIKDGVKTPVKIEVHHTSEQLLTVHEELAAFHRLHEQKVNYYKAKVKNLVTEENARIAKVNADAQIEASNTNNPLQSAYETALNTENQKMSVIHTEFEKTRQTQIKEIASMRIDVDPRFQPVIDIFLPILSDKQE